MNKWLVALIVLLVLYAIGSIVILLFFNGLGDSSDKIVVVPIQGVITTSEGNDLFSSGVLVSGNLIEDIKSLEGDDSVKGIIFEIDSPGGSAVASQEIADTINGLNKINYALIRGFGASGGYWIASASDRVIASPISVTGSIGVIASYLEFSESFEKYGINYERLVAGDKKDIGSQFRELSSSERKLLQSKLDLIHEFFINEVAKNRNMSISEVREIATGEFFLGSEALELGLIDELGNREKTVELMKKELNITNIKVVEKKFERGLLDVVLGNMAYTFGRGVARELVETDFGNKFDVRA